MIRYLPTVLGALAVIPACGRPASTTGPSDVSGEPRTAADSATVSVDAGGATIDAPVDAPPPVNADAARPSLGLERCDPSAPLPPVTFENYYPTKRRCKLAGDYDPAHFCTIARALASQGVTWTSPLVLSREQSSTLIAKQRGIGMQPGGITVNPRPSGEVMVHQNDEFRMYCVKISPSAITISLWKYIAF